AQRQKPATCLASRARKCLASWSGAPNVRDDRFKVLGETRGVLDAWQRAHSAAIAGHAAVAVARQVQNASDRFAGGPCLPSSCSKAEKHQEVDPRALDAAEGRSRAERLRVGERGAQAEDARELVLDRRFVVRLLPELPADPRDQPRRDLLTDRDLRPAAKIGFELENANPDVSLDCRYDLRREEAGGE